MRVPSLRHGLVFLLLTAHVVCYGGLSFAGAPDPAAAREAMAARLRAKGIRDERVLAAMRKVPRHEFVEGQAKALAYQDTELPIESGQMMPTPYVTALMMEQLRLRPRVKVLQVGTDSGYQCALLAEITNHVYAVEPRPEVATAARKRLKKLKYSGIVGKVGDWWKGWPEHAPYDAIVVTGACDCYPQALLDQLRHGGRLVVPIGEGPVQTLNCVLKQDEKHARIEAGITIRISSVLTMPEEP